jgi:thiamine kinase-like enzyme
MLPHELESVAARHVPGTGKLAIHRLRNGLVNATYRVLRDGGVYALRVAASNPYGLGLDRAWEARVLERAVLAGLAPGLEYCDPQRGILISRWIDGRSWTPADVRARTNIARMADVARRIHALPIPTPARVMTPSTWIEYYSAAVQQSARVGASTPATPSTPGVPSAAAALRSAATARLAALAALPRVDPVVCHSDLHTLNLIDRGDSLVLLDWEYAHASDPLWDLAGWSANNDFEDELKHDLLACYTGRPPTHGEYLRLELLGWLYDYICLLWSELYLNLYRDLRPSLDASGVAAPDAAVADDGAQGDFTGGGVSDRTELLEARLNAAK